jgi:integrase
MGIKISFYQGTRHSSATEAVNRVGMDRVQEFLGHTRSTMTRRYAKMNAEGLRPVLRKSGAGNRLETEILSLPKK